MLSRVTVLVSRFSKFRADAVQAKHDVEHWNSINPDEKPISTTFEDAVIAWCDGTGPEPTLADVEKDT